MTATAFNLKDAKAPTWYLRANTAVALWREHIAATRGGAALWRVADFGCGDEKLREPLARSGIPLHYTGFDKLPQSEACVRLDAARAMPDRSFDLAFVLGLVEYLPDLGDFAARLRRVAPRAIVSYVVADSGVFSPEQVAANGWLHHFTAAEIEAIFARAGYVCRSARRIDQQLTGVWFFEAAGPQPAVNDYSILTPYPIPAAVQASKVPNIGDGFIERSIAKLLSPHRCGFAASTRVPLSEAEIERINATRLLVIAGANQLNDNYTIVPGMTPELLGRIRVPIVPVGVGIHGIPTFNRAMSSGTKAIMRAVHERIRCSSWRCPRTVDYLRKQLPEIEGQALMTGCPVTFGHPLLCGESFPTRAERIVVTVTERQDFWQRETDTISFVARRYPRAHKFLSLHQAFRNPPAERSPWAWLKARAGLGPKTPRRLHDYARWHGLEIFVPDDIDRCRAFYDGCDLHIGSRLHAHLYFLSRAKRSFLSAVDERAVGMAEALAFPLCEPSRWERNASYDFERYRTAARLCHQSMARFVSYLQEVLS